MQGLDQKIIDSIKWELSVIWAAHHAVGLSGVMSLYTLDELGPLRPKEAGVSIWFGEKDTEHVIEEIAKYYNGGRLPNSPLLLNPIVHDQNHKPLGSGIIWGTGLVLGIEVMRQDQKERLDNLGVFSGYMERGGLLHAGIKMLAFSKIMLPPLKDGVTVEGCKEMYELSNFNSDEYSYLYMLSGLSYLSKNGAYMSSDFQQIIPEDKDAAKLVASKQVNAMLFADAAFCFKAYDKHHLLYSKFGIDPQNIEHNLKFYNLCARDITLFDAVGPKHLNADTAASFDFLVKGLIPRGAVTVIGASGGVGKSSLAHALAVKAAIDYRPDEPHPTWLGQEINTAKTKGICIYFSGEDGPPIVYSRAKIFDPKGRASRIAFLRTDFGEGVTFASYLRNLMKLPDVPLVVIDPARKYLTGDENDASVVSEFFEAIEEFAIRKHAAMVVVHHLMKGARPKKVAEIYDLLRGSQVFIDRPRVVIGLFNEGNHTVVGLAKNNIPANLGMMQGERLFTRNPTTLELVPIPGSAGRRDDIAEEEEIEVPRKRRS